jgi:hypothetical protein
MIKLIASGGYIISSLAAELGKLPPAMLPVGNKRLYEYQVEFLKQIGDGDIYISLPKDYIIPLKDLDYFSREKIEIISADSDNSISESIINSLSTINRYSESLVILWGDTYIKSKLPDLEWKDFMVISESTDNYNWGHINQENVYVGLFSISSQRNFLHSLSKNRLDFISAIKNYYNEKYPILWKVNPDEWLDFGHLNTYFRSRSQISTTRHFNNFQSDSKKIRKTSENIKKILAEANWFKEVPEKISLHCPRLLNTLENGYELEYLYLLPLNEIFIFGDLPVNVWNKILLSCRDFISLSKEYIDVIPTLNTTSIYKNKTLERLEVFSTQREINLSKKIILNGKHYPSILEIAEICFNNLELETSVPNTLIHGDFCFSNILYDFRSQSIKVIDPRGLDGNGDFSLYGDSDYDIAKLAHSILGGYDAIIAKTQTCRQISLSSRFIYLYNFEFFTSEKLKQIRENFTKLFNLNQNNKIYAIMVLLFLSMLPLHNDNIQKQNSILATGIYLFGEYLK